jgi:hypothetical protein
LACLFLLLTGCSLPEPDCALLGSSVRRFVLDSFTLPTTSGQFGADLDGNHAPENWLLNIIDLADRGSASSQIRVDERLADGTFRPSIELTSLDPSFRDANGAGVVFGSGGKTGLFCGTIADGRYISDDGLGELRPVELELSMPFFDDLALTLTAARIRFEYSPGQLTGQLNACSRPEHLKAIVFPGTAARLTALIAANPRDTLSLQVLSLFDNGGVDEGCNGGCRNPDGSCGVMRNLKIETCEVSTNSIVKNVVTPDVDMFDAEGRYRPTPRRDGVARTPDCISMGVGFTAVEVP